MSDELINVHFTGYIILKGLLPVGKHCQIDLAVIAGKTQCGLNYIIRETLKMGSGYLRVLKLPGLKARWTMTLYTSQQ